MISLPTWKAPLLTSSIRIVFDVTSGNRDTQSDMRIRSIYLTVLVLAFAFFGCEESARSPRTETFTPLPAMETVVEPEDCLTPVEWLESTVPRRLSKVEYTNIVSDVFGLSIDELIAFPADEETMGFDNNARALQASPIHIERYFEAAELVAVQAIRMVIPELECDLAGVEPACLTQWIAQIGQRLWRRPLAVEEVARMLDLFDAGIEDEETEITALSRVLEAMLQSPFFLYRIEVGEPTDRENVFDLTAYEVASRLSFLAWRTGPDHLLLEGASNGDLDTAEGRQEHLERLLDDPRAMRAWWSFFEQWLHLDGRS